MKFFTLWPENGHRITDNGHRTTDTDVILYSVQCCYAVHWTYNNTFVEHRSAVASELLAYLTDNRPKRIKSSNVELVTINFIAELHPLATIFCTTYRY